MSNALENFVLLKLKDGPVIIELLPSLAPNHVERFKELVSENFYNGLSFHRVIKGFIAQTGSPNGLGTDGSGYIIPDEISGAHHDRGVLSMANAGPNTDDSQFFITFTDCPWLDTRHTIFGRVASGMEYVDLINNGGTHSGWPPYGYGAPDKILSMSIIAKEDIPLLYSSDIVPVEIEYLGNI
ncbi:MAG: peptidylprolyl isomerase [Alphaproteobacteria bacterium]